MTEKMRMAEQALEQGKGILRLAPTWVPRHSADQEKG